MLLFQAGMCGFALTGDLFNAFVFFELMSVVAYALTGYRVEEAKAVQGALTFGVLNSRVPATMVAVPALLLAGSLTAGMVPGLGTAVGRAFGVEPDHMPQWTPLGALLGLASAALGAGLAAAAVRGPAHREPRPWTEPLRRLHSGHIGDYVAWLLMGTALLGALALPGVLTG